MFHGDDIVELDRHVILVVLVVRRRGEARVHEQRGHFPVDHERRVRVQTGTSCAAADENEPRGSCDVILLTECVHRAGECTYLVYGRPAIGLPTTFIDLRQSAQHFKRLLFRLLGHYIL